MSNEMNTQEEKKVLTQKDLNKAMFRWYMSAEMPLNFENMQGIAFCGSISHILKKLYTKKEDLSEASLYIFIKIAQESLDLSAFRILFKLIS